MLRANVLKIIRRGISEETSKIRKAPFLKDQMIWVNVENHEGHTERVKVEIGKSLWEGLSNRGVEVGGYCDGGDYYNLREKPVEPNANKPFCQLCLIEVEKYYYNRIFKHKLETEVLEENDDLGFGETRRLACCITVEPWMDNMNLRIPRKMPKDDDSAIR